MLQYMVKVSGLYLTSRPEPILCFFSTYFLSSNSFFLTYFAHYLAIFLLIKGFSGVSPAFEHA